MPHLERDGARIFYEVSGQGRPVLLGHSLLCDGRMWEEVVPTLAEHYRVINIDARGHRHSTAPSEFSLEDLADDWLAILDHEGIDRAALVGLSMGGMTALRLALDSPHRVAGMALIDSNGDHELFLRRLRYRIMTAIYRRQGIATALRAPVSRLMFGRTTMRERPELADQLIARIEPFEREELARAIRAVFGRGPLLHRLGAIDCPVLILIGEEDLATPLDRSQDLQRAISGSRLETIPAAGHLSAVEQPAEVARRVLGFLDQCSWGATQ